MGVVSPEPARACKAWQGSKQRKVFEFPRRQPRLILRDFATATLKRVTERNV